MKDNEGFGLVMTIFITPIALCLFTILTIGCIKLVLMFADYLGL